MRNTKSKKDIGEKLLGNERLKKPDFPDISYVISVKVYPGCYRHIRISGTDTLYNLAEAIMEAFGFEDDHLSAFYMSNKKYDSSSEYGVAFFGMPNESPYDAEDYKLNDFNFHKGSKFLYLFDFGDEWEFRCSILRILNEPTDGWEIVKKVGKNPDQYYDPYDFD